ncbi:hypothetical protein OG264_18415 [Streptomyces xanthophaeus]|nr:hypothetical protein OG264_18415 [Streptomyces xanthophaeus]WST61724.1 hypothetical protein OG605_20020 [Streptomyces xanthophaeus]
MDFLDAYEQWADAHAFFDTTLIPSPVDGQDPLGDQTAAWENRLVAETPNGRLLRDNALFRALGGDGKLHLLHVTHALEQISEHGSLYPSGGCLVGSVYCAPLTPTERGYRMHNLAEYVLTKEAPAFVAKAGTPKRVPTPLIFEINLPPQAYRGLAGVDYLRLGSIHLQIYSRLEYLLSKAERHQLRETIVSRIKNSTAFLALAAAVAYQGAAVQPSTFLRLLDETIPRLPILGYVYFEALAEYLMLHSTTRQTKERAELGEFNNWLYKDMLFASFPHMAGKFDLAKFRPSPEDLGALLARIDPGLDAAHARTYLTERISHLVRGPTLHAWPGPGSLAPHPLGVRQPLHPARPAPRTPDPPRTADLRPVPRLLLLLRPAQGAPGVELLEPHGHHRALQRHDPQGRDRHQPCVPRS